MLGPCQPQRVCLGTANFDVVRAADRHVIDRHVQSRAVLTDAARDDLRSVREDPLTARETEIVKLIAESYSTRQIAQALVISEKTVDRHRTNILEKLGMRDRVELTRYAIRNGLVEA